jgi:predicted lipid-binding transport protein (Tim44 family)
MNRIIPSAAAIAGKAMYRHGRKAFYSLCVFAASATMLYARAGGSGGGHSSSRSSGSYSSGSYHSSGSSFSSTHYYGGGYYGGGGSAGGLFSFFIILFLFVIGFIIYYKFFYTSSATGLEDVPDVEPKDFHSLNGAAEFMAANPDFKEDEFIAKAEKAFTDIQTAWAAGDIRPVRRFLSDGVYQRFSTQIAMMGLLKQKDVISDLTVEEIFIDCIERDGLFDILHVSVTGGMSDEFVCETNHDLDSPGGYETFTEYWSFLRKRGKGGKDLYFSQNCPSCSAPLPPDMGDTGNCPYCKSFVNSGEYDWVLSEITQADDYSIDSYRSSKTADLDKQAETLSSADDGFSVQLLEDKISNGYLQIQTAIAFKDPAKMRRFVSDKAYDKIVASFPKSQIVFNRLYLNDVSVIAVKEEGGKNIIHAAVKSSYQRAVIEGGKAHLLDSEVMTKKEIVVVEREKAAVASRGSIYARRAALLFLIRLMSTAGTAEPCSTAPKTNGSFPIFLNQQNTAEK